MTTPRRDGQNDPWKDWVQENPALDSICAGLSICDSDLWIHRYMSHVDKVGTRDLQHIMLTEWKTFGRTAPFAQADTLHLIDQILRRRGDRRPYYTIKGKRMWVRCWGVHHVTLSGSRPDDSDWMTWDSKPVKVDALEELLRFDRDPYTLKPRTDRRHHTASQSERQQFRLPIEELEASA
jgi:hypothetical protein